MFNLTGSPWPTSNGVASTKEVIQPYLEILPKKAPLFITVNYLFDLLVY